VRKEIEFASHLNRTRTTGTMAAAVAATLNEGQSDLQERIKDATEMRDSLQVRKIRLDVVLVDVVLVGRMKKAHADSFLSSLCVRSNSRFGRKKSSA
jgi:hypothetical protein